MKLAAMIEQWVRETVRDEIARVGGIGNEYTSLDRPPGVSRRAFAESCRRIEGATIEGKVWRVSREAWHRARRRRTTPKPYVDAEARSEEELADRDIREAGYRMTRNRR